MAVWFLRRAGIIVLTLFFRISYCEYDLLENLKPKRDDPPELTAFLRSVLHKKDEFKKIREVAKHLRLHASPIDEDVFLTEQEDDTRMKPRFPIYKHLSRNLKRPLYRTSNLQHHRLSRRSGIEDRPINDVYPYMYDENTNEGDTDERQERSSWKDIKEKKHKHHSYLRGRKRFRRGLDLTDYSSDNDLERGNIKIFPRSRIGFRIVPGNKYQQRRDVSTRRNTKRRFLEGKSVADILGSTERAIPDDVSSEHDILGFKAESKAESDLTEKREGKHDNRAPEDNSILKLEGNLDLIDHTNTQSKGVDRKKRSMKLNIIDDNNLITHITQDNSAKTVVLTLKNEKAKQRKENSQRKTPATPDPGDFESLHKALHFSGAYIKIHENPSNAVDIPKSQEIQPDIFIELNKQNKEQDYKDSQDIIKPNEANNAPLIYQIEEDVNIEKEDQDDKEQKKNMLQDMDEPTSALEQYELSTKPYIIGVPKSEDIISPFDSAKRGTEFLDLADSSTSRGNQFIVKESKDMVHGNNKKSLIFMDKRGTKRKIPILQRHKPKKIYNEGEDKTNDVDEVFKEHDSKGDSRKIDEIVKDLELTDGDDYQDQQEDHYQGRKLQSFDENEDNQREDDQGEDNQREYVQKEDNQREYIQRDDLNVDNTRYGYLDYENGRNSHIREPGFTENKIRVKRDLTDLFGMNNDEEYSEDLIDDYNPSIKQERSDYSYEEEGDSAVPEKQVYFKKKKTKDKLANKHVENLDTTSETSSITSEHPARCGSGNHTIKIKGGKAGQTTDNLKNQDNIKIDDNINLNHHNIVNKVRRECDNCKDNKKSKNHKCDNCKPGNEGDEHCKNCNKNGQKWPSTVWYAENPIEKVTDSQIISNILDTDADKENPWKSIESGNMRNMKIRSNNQTNSSIPGGCNTNATFHHKTTSNNTSSEENKKPPKEEANADQVEFKFNNPKNQTDPCDTANSTVDSVIKSKLKELRQQSLQEQKNAVAGIEAGDQEETDLGETAGYAHHPLKSKNTHTINDSNQETKTNVDDVLTHFHTKHNQNEFNHNNQKPAREELPDVETIAERSDESNYQQLFRDNHNEERHENNGGIRKDKMVTQKVANENENEGELYLLEDSYKNSEMNDNKRELENKEEQEGQAGQAEQRGQAGQEGQDGQEVQEGQENKYKRDVTMKKNEQGNKYHKVRKLREKKNSNRFLLNSVENFANIVEEDIHKKINKRNTNDQKQKNKIGEQNEAYLRNIQINGYANDAPFEKFSKLNQGYWKKSSKRRIPDAYLQQNEYHRKTPPTYSNKHVRYLNTNNLRRIRRDQFSKVPEMRNKNANENAQRDENRYSKLSNIIGRVVRTKGQCNDNRADKHKSVMKEWLNPKRPKPNHKSCLLGQDAGLNPSFGLKPSKGSCNDEAELERGSKDYSQLHDALNGHLASLVVQTTFKRIKEHPQLKNRFSHGLARQHGFKNEMKNLNAFRNNETEGDVKHTEEMLRQIMTVLNKIILDQVRRRTCKHLSPELQKHLASITKEGKKKPVDEESKISEEGFPLPLVKEGKPKDKPIDTEQGDFLFSNPTNKAELETDEEEVKKKMKMIKELLNKYKHMSSECKIKVEAVEEYLKKHLCLLKKILKEIKQQRAQESKQQQTNKLKRKNYEGPPDVNENPPDFSLYNQLTKTDMINKQLNSLGLGPSPNYKPQFNLNQLIEDTKFKMKLKDQQENAPTKDHVANAKSSYRNENLEALEAEEDYENPKNEHKREIVRGEKKRKLSEKYKKLAQAAESFRKKREIEERLGKLFGNPEKRSVRNENYETIKSLNKQYRDYSRIGFETPQVFSLKK